MFRIIVFYRIPHLSDYLIYRSYDSSTIEGVGINLAYPLEDDLPVKVPNIFFNRHENMLNQLAKKYNCEIDDLTPIVNLILS